MGWGSPSGDVLKVERARRCWRRFARDWHRSPGALDLRQAKAVLCSEARFTSTAGRRRREAAIAKVLQNAGGNLLAYCLTFEKTTSFSSPIAPDNHAAIIGAAGGSISNLKTTVAVTSKEALAAFKTAGDMAEAFKSAAR
jgi:hypothetical protein